MTGAVRGYRETAHAEGSLRMQYHRKARQFEVLKQRNVLIGLLAMMWVGETVCQYKQFYWSAYVKENLLVLTQGVPLGRSKLSKRIL